MKISVFLTVSGLFWLAVSCSQQTRVAVSAPAPEAAASFSPGQGFNPQGPASPPESGAYSSQKQVKTGSVVLEVSDPPAVERTLAGKLKAVGGFVESSVATTSSRSLTLRIPAPAFDSFLEGMTAWGRMTHRQVAVSDVTVQYYDLETRLKNQRILLDQYRGFLAQTKKMDEILDVMGRISGLTTEIESTEGQFRYLTRQVDYSTLGVELTLPLLSQGRDWPDWEGNWSELAHNLADFGVETVFFLLAALVIGPVLMGATALLVWLFVGRPALWRRFKNLRYRPKTGFTAPPGH